MWDNEIDMIDALEEIVTLMSLMGLLSLLILRLSHCSLQQATAPNAERWAHGENVCDRLGP